MTDEESDILSASAAVRSPFPMNDEEIAAQPPEPPAGSAGQGSAMAPEISRRVASILDAVEHEAARLREDARIEAARYSENARRRADDLVEERRRRISELSDELVARSEAVVARLGDAAPVLQGFENLVRALGDAAERLSRESERTADDFEPPPFHEGSRAPVPESPPAYVPPPAAPPFYEPPPQPAPAIPAQRQTPLPPPPPRPPPPWMARPGPDAARMIAIQMATAGSTRGDVRGHLNNVLGIPDAGPLLDEIFGAGVGDDARAPWMTGRR